MSVARSITGLLLWAMLVALSSCTTRSAVGPDVPPRHAVLVVFDTLRADRMSVYGHDRETTPYLESLAGEMVRWAALKAPESWTLPTHASLFTGRWPAEHHVHWGQKTLGADLLTIAEVLQAEGFCTFGLSSNPMIHKKTGFGQGFDLFDNVPKPHETKTQRLLARLPELLHRAVERDCRLFLFLNVMDTHTPVVTAGHDREFGVDGPGPITNPQEKWEINAGVRELPPETRLQNAAAYDAAVRGVDDTARAIVSLLREQALLEETVLVLTSDHGEGLDRELGHVLSAWEEQLAVPLLVRFPGGQDGGRVLDAPESAVALGPTLLDWLAVLRPAAMADVPALGSAATPAADHRSYFDEAFTGNQRMRESYPQLAAATPHVHVVYCPPHKLIVRSDRTVSLFDLTTDPSETQDLAVKQPVATRACVMRYRELLAAGRLTSFETRLEPGTDDAVDEETLRSLGYLQ